MSGRIALAPEIEAERMRLYRADFSDKKIADMTGAKPCTISAWRYKRKLPANKGTLNCQMAEGVNERRLLLYTFGMSDGQIAAQENIRVWAITRWRKIRGLPANFEPGRGSLAPRPTIDDLCQRVRDAIGFRYPRDIIDDIMSDMFVALLDGTLPLSEVERKARRYRGDTLQRFANKFASRSLDAEIGDAGGLTFVATLADDSHSEWLEQMGATVW